MVTQEKKSGYKEIIKEIDDKAKQKCAYFIKIVIKKHKHMTRFSAIY